MRRKSTYYNEKGIFGQIFDFFFKNLDYNFDFFFNLDQKFSFSLKYFAFFDNLD